MPDFNNITSTIQSRIRNNPIERISGNDVRDMLLLTLNKIPNVVYDPTFNYEENSICTRANVVFVANKATTGEFKPSDWDTAPLNFYLGTIDNNAPINQPLSARRINDFVRDIVSSNSSDLAQQIAQLTANLQAEIDDRIEEISIVNQDIAAEEDARIAADNTLQANIDTLTNNVAGDVASLTASIQNEESARITADGTLTTAINNEASARTASDTILQQNINTVNSNILFENNTEGEIEAKTAAPINMQDENIVNMPDPVDPRDAANKAYVDNAMLSAGDSRYAGIANRTSPPASPVNNTWYYGDTEGSYSAYGLGTFSGLVILSYTNDTWSGTDIDVPLTGVVNLVGNQTIGGVKTFSDPILLNDTRPEVRLTESDTNTTATLFVSGGTAFLQVGESGQGISASSGDILVSGYGVRDINSFKVRSGGVNHDVYHAGNASNSLMNLTTNQSVSGAKTFRNKLNIPVVGNALDLRSTSSLGNADNWISLGNGAYDWQLKYVGSTSGDSGNEFRIESSGTSGTGAFWQIDHTGDVSVSNDGTHTFRVWNSGNDGSGSGLDADLIDGIQGSQIVRNDGFSIDRTNYTIENFSDASEGRIFSRWVANEHNDNFPEGDAGQYWAFNGASYQRSFALFKRFGTNKYFLAGLNSNTEMSEDWGRIWHSEDQGSGSGMDSDLLDGQHGNYYLNTLTNNQFIDAHVGYEFAHENTFNINDTTSTLGLGSNHASNGSAISFLKYDENDFESEYSIVMNNTDDALNVTFGTDEVPSANATLMSIKANGNVEVAASAPIEDEDLTRKDYVDAGDIQTPRFIRSDVDAEHNFLYQASSSRVFNLDTLPIGGTFKIYNNVAGNITHNVVSATGYLFNGTSVTGNTNSPVTVNGNNLYMIEKVSHQIVVAYPLTNI